MTEALQRVEPAAGAVGIHAASGRRQVANERLEAELAAVLRREESQRTELEGVCRVEERRAGREVEGARIPASSAFSPVPSTPLQLRFLSPLIEPSVRISRTGLSFEIIPSPTQGSRPHFQARESHVVP